MTGAQDTIAADFSGQVGSFALEAAFSAPMRGVTAIFGPSGSGKTTILRCIAGLERLEGRLSVNGRVWQDDRAGIFRKPHQRSIGYVFQEPSLFPHLSVRGNLLYGARRVRRNDTPPPISEAETVDLLGLTALMGRAPDKLSGGERQRVAIGRALLSRPRLLLMDEPLAALDQTAKAEILPFLEAIHLHLSVPIIYVSHDMAEVGRLADSLVLLDRGRVIASGPLSALETDPDLPLLRAPAATVTLEGRIAALDEAYALTRFAIPGGELTVPGLQGRIGDLRRLRIGVSDVSFTLQPPDDTTILNCPPVQILSISDHDDAGAQKNIVAALGHGGDGGRIAARITRKGLEKLDLREGSEVFAQIKSVALGASGAGR
ncbi:MAG: molybdenum ABC transporter ATP-binding protein [Rhodomicrobiaceae bacterium]